MSENEITELPNQNHVTIGAVIDDLLSGQIDGDYQNLSRAISGPFTDEIQSIFPDSYQALYLLTSVGRRQVWHALIAAMRPEIDCPVQIEAPGDLRQQFLRESNHNLLQDAYGDLPAGFGGALAALGPNAAPPQCYRALFDFMTHDEGLRKQICHSKVIRPQTIAILEELDPPYRNLEIASQLTGKATARRLTLVARILALNPSQDGDQDCRSPVSLRAFVTLLRRRYYSTSFPVPPVPETDFCLPLDTGRKMFDAGRRLQNCISSYIPEAIRGEHYYYEWTGDEPAMIQLVSDHPYGWIFATCLGPSNRRIAPATIQAIKCHFAKFNIEPRLRIEGLIKSVDVAPEIWLRGEGRHPDAEFDFADFGAEFDVA